MHMTPSSSRELPRGLEAYEFARELCPSQKYHSLYHFIPKRNPETGKPVLTADLQADQQPFHWDALFAAQPDHLEIEIGSGKGGFLVEYGKAHPERFILGTEWDVQCANYAADRLVRHELSHCRMLRGDVFYFLRDRAPSNSVDAFHMYFPDPWPKKKKLKNRLLRPEFLTEVARVLKPGKRRFYWGTDHEEYNLWAQEIFAQTPNLKVLVKDSAEPTEGIMTNFEIKYRREGRPIYRSILEFEKN